MHRRLLGLMVVTLALALVACETDTPTAKERQELTPAVHTFLVKLAQAYAAMDTTPLKGIASPRMMESVRENMDLVRAGGDRLEPKLLSETITSMKVLRHTNAVISVTEVWDTKRIDAMTGQVIGEDKATTLHSHIQLRLVNGSWMVLYREVDETARGPRLILPTPKPE